MATNLPNSIDFVSEGKAVWLERRVGEVHAIVTPQPQKGPKAGETRRQPRQGRPGSIRPAPCRTDALTPALAAARPADPSPARTL